MSVRITSDTSGHSPRGDRWVVILAALATTVSLVAVCLVARWSW